MVVVCYLGVLLADILSASYSAESMVPFNTACVLHFCFHSAVGAQSTAVQPARSGFAFARPRLGTAERRPANLRGKNGEKDTLHVSLLNTLLNCNIDFFIIYKFAECLKEMNQNVFFFANVGCISLQPLNHILYFIFSVWLISQSKTCNMLSMLF
jgi:hypothetical protein